MADSSKPKDNSTPNNSPPEKGSDSKAPTSHKTALEIIQGITERQQKIEAQTAKLREDRERVEQIQKQVGAMLPKLPKPSQPERGESKPSPPPVNMYDIADGYRRFVDWITYFTTPRPEQRASLKATPEGEMDKPSQKQSDLVGAQEPETVQSPAMDQFFDDIAEKKSQLRAWATSYGMAASDVFAWSWGEWNRFAFVAGGFLVGGGVALSVSAYVAAEILFAIGIALFIAKGIHDLWSNKRRIEIAVILCFLGIVAIVGQAVLIEWNRPRQQEGAVKPVSSTAPKALPRFDKFMSEPRLVHGSSYLIYKVAHPADLSPIEFYVRLGTLGGEEMRVVAYVVSPYQREQVMTTIARNWETILEHLKAHAKENGFLEISVSRTVILHVDLGGTEPISFPKEAREKGIHFEIERRMF